MRMNIENQNLKYNIGSSVTLVNLSNHSYSGKSGLIKNYNNEKQRYVINLNDADKIISVKNIQLDENDSSMNVRKTECNWLL